jgi:translocator protein
VGFVGLCLLVGVVDGELAAGSLATWYLSLTPPFGMLPSYLLAPLWSALSVLVGLAGWRVWRRTGASVPLRLWGWQLLLSALWTPAFFALHSTAAGLVVILVLWPLLVLTVRAFMRVEPVAAALMLPYGVWTGYATYLTAGFWWLN